MSLDKYSYSEYPDMTNKWEIKDVSFINFNLVVGKNSSGKTRLLNTINSLANILTGQRKIPFDNCEWNIELNLQNKKFVYQLVFKNKAVFSEELKVDGDLKLKRNDDGTGLIWYEKQNDMLDFKLPSDVVAAVNRRDEVQHTFLIELNLWAKNVILYKFGTNFGIDKVLGINETQTLLSNNSEQTYIDEPDHVVKAYSTAYQKFKDKLDKSIIKDMKQLGYNISDVGCDNVQTMLNFPFAALTMYTVEKDLNFKNPQIQMSQGMWRALALVIHLNICAFSKIKELVLIDDIGEGLDYTRSLAIINLLIKKEKSNKFQLIITSNDRFVMNEVPLNYWSIIQRKVGTVKVFNQRNAQKAFDKFKFLGLNNFDFFASNFFQTKK